MAFFFLKELSEVILFLQKEVDLSELALAFVTFPLPCPFLVRYFFVFLSSLTLHSSLDRSH